MITQTSTISVDVQLVAATVGFGCTYDHPGANGAQVTIDSADGRRLGVGTMQLTDGAEVCDWTASVGVDDGLDLYVIRAGGREVATVTSGDIADGHVRIDIDQSRATVS